MPHASNEGADQLTHADPTGYDVTKRIHPNECDGLILQPFMDATKFAK